MDASRGIRLYQGDALVLLKRSKAEMFDLIFADPPYFLSNGGITCQSGKMVSVNKGKWDEAAEFPKEHEFNVEWLTKCKRVLKPNGTIFVSATAQQRQAYAFRYFQSLRRSSANETV